GRPELREALLAQLLLHENGDAQGNEFADADDAAAGLLLRRADAVLASDERDDLRARDHLAFDDHPPVREREGGQVLDLVEPAEPLRIDLEQALLRGGEREGASREGLRRLDAGARHGRGDAAAAFVL